MLRRSSLLVIAVALAPATVHAFDHHHHHGDGGGGCGHASPTAGGTSVTATPPSPLPSPAPTAGEKRVFVTSTVFSGAVGGLAAADLQCQTAAGRAGLTGLFRAWISDGATSAYDRTASSSGPWYTTGEALAFATRADLRGPPAATLRDELGGIPDGVATTGAWTGSDSEGRATGQDCDGWTNATVAATATTGSGLGFDTAWGGGHATRRCDQKAPLLCVEK